MESDNPDYETPPTLPQYGAPKGIPHAGPAQKPLMKIMGRMLHPKMPSKSAIHIGHGRRATKDRRNNPKFY